MHNPLKLMLVTQHIQGSVSDYVDFVEQCVLGGVTSVQLRQKFATYTQLLDFGCYLMERLAPYDIPLIVNDNAQLALALNASGLHVGQEDNPEQILDKVPKFFIQGISIESLEQLSAANQIDGWTYVAASAVFATYNKSDVKTLWGIEGLKKVVQASRHPVVAIGGINLHNLAMVLATGVAGVAVIGALHEAKQPYETAKKIRNLIDAS